MSARPNPPSSNVRKDQGSAHASLSDAIRRRKQRLHDAQEHAKIRLNVVDDQIGLELDAIDRQLTAWVEFQTDVEEKKRQENLEREQLNRLSEKIQKRQAETETQRQQIARKLAAQRREVLQSQEDVRDEASALRQENQTLVRTLDELTEQIERLQSEKGHPRTLLADSHSGSSDSGNISKETSDTLDQLQTELERALDEIQQLRDDNESLQKRLEAAPERRPRSPAAAKTLPRVPGTPGATDWESQKKRLLEQLEDDTSDTAADEYGDDSTDETLDDMSELVTRAEQLVAERDEQIRLLQQRLSTAESQALASALSAADEPRQRIVEVLDKDELVQQERERLKKMQDDWEEKSRKAEVETAMERARIARMRTELEERIRGLEAKQQQFAQRNPAGNAPNKPERERRWLDHLARPKEGEK